MNYFYQKRGFWVDIVFSFFFLCWVLLEGFSGGGEGGGGQTIIFYLISISFEIKF